MTQRTAHNKGKSRLAGHYVNKTWRYQVIVALLFFLLLPLLISVYGKDKELTTPCPVYGCLVVFAEGLPEPTQAPISPDYAAIKADIYQVFGHDAPEAMKLLSCENSSLNPKAVNHNTDAIKSTDYGIFQINDHWQGVTNTAFLTDPAINIRMAYRIFVNNGHSFERWSCGRKLGLK